MFMENELGLGKVRGAEGGGAYKLAHVAEVHAKGAREEGDGGGEEGDEGEGVEGAVHHVLLQLRQQPRHLLHPLPPLLRPRRQRAHLPARMRCFRPSQPLAPVVSSPILVVSSPVSVATSPA